MFTEPTAIILGAGASMPYGYPSGFKLVSDIIDLVAIHNASPCINDGHFKTATTAAGIHSDHVIDFAQTLYEAFPPSIDYFLFHNPRFMDVGKLAIARCIIRYENKTDIFDRSNEARWYHKLADCIVNPKTADITKALSIVTFNYDRSLPHFLHTALKARFHLSDEEAAQRLAVVPFVHVYGHVGLLPWEQKTNKNDPVRDYVYKTDPDEIRIAARGIHTIGQSNGGDGPKRARQLLEGSQYVFVLGFGFQDDNCELIGLNSASIRSRHVTRCGLSQAMLLIKAQRYNLTWEDKGQSIPWDVRTFLDSSPQFLAAAGV